jgi:hypothetical protein
MPDFGGRKPSDFGGRRPAGGDPSLNELNRADRFLDALAAKQPVYSTDASEAELAFLLADWRDTIRDPAPTVPVTARDAVTALNDGLTKRHSRGSLVIAGSTAAALLCIGGFGAAIYGADPGGTLYGARTALFGTQRVSDDEVMLAAQTEMQHVQTLIDQGQWEQAQTKLQQLSPKVQSLDVPEHKQQLIQQWNALTYKVVEQNPEATLPPAGEPLPALPSSPLTLLPVPVIVPGASPSSTSTTSSTSATSTTSSASATSSAESTSTEPSATSSPAGTTSSGTSTTPSSSGSASRPSEPVSPQSSTVSSPPPASSSTPEPSPAPATSQTTGAPATSATATPTPSTSVAAPTSAASSTQVTTSVTVTQTAVSASPTAIPSPVTTVTMPSHEVPSTHRGSPAHGSSESDQNSGEQPTQQQTTQQRGQSSQH